MKRIFEIEWPDENGPMWMNVDNLMFCLKSEQHIGLDVEIKVIDITEQII